MVDPNLLSRLKDSLPSNFVVELDKVGCDLTQPLESKLMTTAPYIHLQHMITTQANQTRLNQLLALLTWAITPEDVVERYLDFDLHRYQEMSIRNYVRLGYDLFSFQDKIAILSQLSVKLFQWQLTLASDGELVVPSTSSIISRYLVVPTPTDLKFAIAINGLTHDKYLFAWEFNRGRWLEINDPSTHRKIHETLQGLKMVLRLNDINFDRYSYVEIVERASTVLNDS